MLSSIADTLEFYFAITFVPVGIVTNLVSALVFLRKNLNATNMGFFNFLISFSNLFTLVYYLFVMESSRIFNYDLSITSDFACKLTYLLRRVIREIAPIIEVVMTFERFMSVYCPARYGFIQKRSFLVAIIVLIFTTFVFVSFENFFYYLDLKNGTYQCTSSSLAAASSDLVSATLRTFLPFTCMLILNVLMTRRLIKRKLIRSTVISASSTSKSRRDYQFTVSVLSMNALFLVLNFPVSIGYILRVIVTGTSLAAQRIEFYWRVAYLVATSQYIFTNLTNIIFNRLFRDELIKILIGERNMATPQNTTPNQHRRVSNFDNLNG